MLKIMAVRARDGIIGLGSPHSIMYLYTPGLITLVGLEKDWWQGEIDRRPWVDVRGLGKLLWEIWMRVWQMVAVKRRFWSILVSLFPVRKDSLIMTFLWQYFLLAVFVCLFVLTNKNLQLTKLIFLCQDRVFTFCYPKNIHKYLK